MEDKKGCVHVGNVSLENIDFINSSAEIIIILGEKNFWNKGIGTIAFGIAIEHGFKKLGLHRLYAGTHEANEGSIRIFKKNDMLFEGRKVDSYKRNNKYSDTVHYSILSTDFFKKDSI